MNINTEQLTEMIINSMDNGTSDIVVDLENMDNELILQILANIFNHILTLSNINNSIEEVLNIVQIVILKVGYDMHHKIIDRNTINKIIYYAKITNSQQNMLQSYFHPIYLMSLMPEDKVPSVYKKLMFNRNYLPNIVLLYDPKPESETLYTVVMQKINARNI